MTETIETIAQQAGVSPTLLQEYAEYAVRKAKEYPEVFAADPEAFIDQAIRHRNQQAMTFFNEALSNPNKFNELVEQVETHLQHTCSS